MTEPDNARAAHGVPDIVIITGMSGAGRSTAANALEDLGWYVVDNLPPALLKKFGSVKAISAASDAEIAEVPGIGPRLAATITSALRTEEPGPSRRLAT